MTVEEYEFDKKVDIDINDYHKRGKLILLIDDKVVAIKLELPNTEWNHYYSKVELFTLESVTINQD